MPPSSPSTPRNKLNLIVGGVLGLFLAGIAVLLKENLDNRIKSPDELKELTGMPILGSVVRYPDEANGEPINLGEKPGHNRMAEAYKFLRTNLEFAAAANGPLRSLLVTSSSPAEGKTTTAVNLAVATAREGKVVVLIDGDLRKPALHRVFGLVSGKGLTNLLINDASLEEVLRETSVEGLQVISSGPLPPDATVMLRSAKLKSVVEELLGTVDLVIIDSPPLLSVTDPMLMMSLVDGVLMVVDAHGTGRDTVQRGAETLQMSPPGVVGVVMNKVTAKRSGYNYYYHSGYGEEQQANGSKGVLAKLWGRNGRSSGRGNGHGNILSRLAGRGRSSRG